MAEITGREPGLPQDNPITGDEPQLGGKRREKPVYWTGVGVLRLIEFTFGVVREQTALEIGMCLQRRDSLMIIDPVQDRTFLLQPHLFLRDVRALITGRSAETGLYRCEFVGWASESYPEHSHAALLVMVGPDLTEFTLDIGLPPGHNSPFFSDIV